MGGGFQWRTQVHRSKCTYLTLAYSVHWAAEGGGGDPMEHTGTQIQMYIPVSCSKCTLRGGGGVGHRYTTAGVHTCLLHTVCTGEGEDTGTQLQVYIPVSLHTVYTGERTQVHGSRCTYLSLAHSVHWGDDTGTQIQVYIPVSLHTVYPGERTQVHRSRCTYLSLCTQCTLGRGHRYTAPGVHTCLFGHSVPWGEDTGTQIQVNIPVSLHTVYTGERIQVHRSRCTYLSLCTQCTLGRGHRYTDPSVHTCLLHTVYTGERTQVHGSRCTYLSLCTQCTLGRGHRYTTPGVHTCLLLTVYTGERTQVHRSRCTYLSLCTQCTLGRGHRYTDPGVHTCLLLTVYTGERTQVHNSRCTYLSLAHSVTAPKGNTVFNLLFAACRRS